jgi:hypothetical protein
LAKERQETHFRARPHDSDTEYLLTTLRRPLGCPASPASMILPTIRCFACRCLATERWS